MYNIETYSFPLKQLVYESAPELRDLTGFIRHAAGRVQSEFDFDAAGGRARQVKERIAPNDSCEIETTLYLGAYERENHTTKTNELASAVLVKTVHRHSLGGGMIYTRTFGGSEPGTKLTNVLKDHLGSTDALVVGIWNGTTFANQSIERLSFDAWGERRDASTQISYRASDSDPFRTSAKDHDRGYTGHEQLDDSGLIHMNGRIYDPELGRFLSPDPIVQIPEYSQNFNRYSYVLNNPLNATDPSGFSFISKAFSKIGSFIMENWRTIVVVVVVAVAAWAASAYLSGLGGMFTTTGAVGGQLSATGMAVSGGFAGAIGGGLGPALNGGDIGDVLRGAVVGGIQGAIAGGVLHGMTPQNPGFNMATAKHVAGHGILGGTANEAMGGKFQDGFFSAGASAAAGDYGLLGDANATGPTAVASRTIKASVVGGTVSVLGGGKFANGAYTAAFQHLMNHEGLLESFYANSPTGIGLALKLSRGATGQTLDGTELQEPRQVWGERFIIDVAGCITGASAINATAAQGGVFYRAMSNAEYAAMVRNNGLTYLPGKELFVSPSVNYSRAYLQKAGYDVLVKITMKPGAMKYINQVTVGHRTAAGASGWAARGSLLWKMEQGVRNIGIQSNTHIFNPLIKSFNIIK